VSDDDKLWFGDLYHLVLDYDGENLLDDVLMGWLSDGEEIMRLLAPAKRLSATPEDKDEKQFILWDLYALSRISDFLLLAFQSNESNKWDGPSISSDQFLSFFEKLGFNRFEPRNGDRFSPFHHEVVSVTISENPKEPISILQAQWPGLMYGEMLFARSGVKVKGGANFINKAVAETSTLYFAHRRLNRPTEDLSIGWGHNSQWRTDFRRDYELDGQLLFNVDGKTELSTNASYADLGTLSKEEQLELCVNRCFIKTEKPHADLWPYDKKLTIPAENLKGMAR